jgi:hypothetical protein
MFYRLFLPLVLIFISIQSYAQELDFKVSVITASSIKSLSTGASTAADLQKSLTELINNTRWGDDEFQQFEKIKGSIQITLTDEPQPTVFKAELAIKTERPVYNSIYNSPMINILDRNVTFSYNGLLQFQKTTNTFYDNVSAIISFYVYYSMGMDYDSFRMNGGEPFFLKAQELINSLPSNYVNDEGWRNNGGIKKNRYWLIENIMNPRMRQFRHAFYEYHRLGLDKMYDDSDKHRAVMLSTLTSISQANAEYPNTYLLQMFEDTKKDEIIEIFKLGDVGQKSKVKLIMQGIDPSKADKYNVLN